MSFILDALRKSEHERERRALPGLVEAPVARASRPLLPWILGGVVVLLVVNAAILVGFLSRPAPTPAPPPATVAPVVPVVPAAPAGPATVAAPPAPTVPSATPPADGRVRPLAAEAEPVEPTLEVPEPPPVVHRDSVAAPVAAGPARAGPAPSAPLLRQLPAAVAGALPPLNLDLHVYSPVAAQRFVIVNGQRLREGGTLREGLSVEQITPEGVILNHQGTRFTLSHE